MVVAAVLCLCAAVVTAAQAVWSLTRPPTVDYVRQVLRAVAPTQLAAAAMLAAGAVVASGGQPPDVHGRAHRLRRQAPSARWRPAAGRAPRRSCAMSSTGARRRQPAAAAPARRARCPAAESVAADVDRVASPAATTASAGAAAPATTDRPAARRARQRATPTTRSSRRARSRPPADRSSSRSSRRRSAPPRSPARCASGSASRSTITIRPCTCRRPGTPLGRRPTRSVARHSAASRLTGPPMNIVFGLVASLAHCGSTL